MYVIGAWSFTSLEELNYPNESIRVNIGHKVVIIIQVRSVIIGVFRRIKILITILYKLVDLIKVVRIKIVTLDAKVSFDRFGKELRLISVSFGGFRVNSQSRIIAQALWFEEVFDFTPRLRWFVSKLMSLQNFSQLACDSIPRLSLISFCN